MKTKKSAILLAITSLLLVVTAVFSTVTANNDQGYTTTITLSDGHTVDVANITESDVISEEDYIKQNLNTDLVQDTGKFELADFILAKNLIADESLFNGDEETIQSLNERHLEAFIVMNDTTVLAYDLDENSDYYVAKANTLMNDSNYRTAFADFAYMNVNGEAIYDAIYDYETGLAYIPKYYKEENKNGLGYFNVQVELLQMTSTQTPSTTIDVKVNVEDMPGEYAVSGRATVKALATDFGLKVALDDEAINNTYSENIRVKVNGVRIENWYYYDSEGIIQVLLEPNDINSIEIDISKENADTYLEELEKSSQFLDSDTSLSANANTMKVKTPAKTWVFEDEPQVNDTYTLVCSTNGSLNSPFVDIYFNQERSATADTYLDVDFINQQVFEEIAYRIKNDNASTFDLNNLNMSNGMIQHSVRFNEDFTSTDGNLTIPAGAVLDLRCAHGWKAARANGQSVKISDGATTTYYNGVQVRISWGMFVRVLEVQDEYLVVGVVTNELNRQNGASIFKVRYEAEGGGQVTVYKKDPETIDAKNGDATRRGAVYEIVSETNDVVSRLTLEENGKATTTEKIKKGHYTVREVVAPVGYKLNPATFGVDVTKDNKTPTVEVYDDVIKNDIVINKQLEATSNTEQVPLADCQFKATLKSDRSKVYYSEYTPEGIYTIKDLPYGTYEVEETQSSPFALTCDKFTIFIEKDKTERGPYTAADATFETERLAQNPNRIKWTDEFNNLVDITKVMVIKVHKEDFDRTEADDKTYTQGDAQLKGAVYEIYKYNETTGEYSDYVYDITVDHIEDGYWTAKSDELIVGKYMVKEKIKNTEVVDGVTYNYSYAPGYLADLEEHYLEQEPGEQTVRVTVHDTLSREEVIRGRVSITKFDGDRSTDDNNNDSEVVGSAGAVLRLTLNSNENIYYEVTLDNKGEGEFLEHNDETHVSTAAHDSMKYYPNTIPYGEYTITEIKEGINSENESFFIQPEEVTISNHLQHENRIVSDIAFPIWLKIVKRDLLTNQIVKETGAKFKVWNVREGRFEKQKVYPATETEIFETNEEGYCYLPERLYGGEYVIYEIQAPNGYYLDDEYRLPDNPADYGVVGGKKIHLDKVATGYANDTVNPGHVEVGEIEYAVDIKNTPLYINIKIVKTSERLTGASQSTVSYTTATDEVELEKTTPVYTDGIGLQGVKYEIYANEDITSPDGQIRVNNGTLVDTVVTDEDGIGQSRLDLFPGKYKVVEVEVPEGYLLDPNPKFITAVNENQYVQSETSTLELSDVRQHLGYKFKKIFEQYKYATGQEQKHAVFGIYNKEVINNYRGNAVINPDSLVDLLEVVGDNFVETTTDLPNGKYYVKELYVSYPYALSTEVVNFELKYKNDGVTQKVVLEGEEVENTIDTGYAKFIKLSKSIDDGLIINGSEYHADGLDKKAAQILEYVKNMSREQMLAYFKEEGVKFVEGAVYEIWLDEEGTNKLQEVNLQTGDMKVATFTTDDCGVLELFELPKGAFYLKEVIAPDGYEVQNDVVPFEITASNPEATIFQAIYDEATLATGLHKTDIYTGEDVPNCKFEIRDEDNNLLMYSVTDETGMAYIPQDMFEEGKTYYYIELEAPDVYKDDGRLYELNTEPHEFVAHFDENGDWAAEKVEVENYRPTTNVKFVKTDEESNLVPNCKFELKSEEENLYYKTGVTDENGIYVFENVPQGWYTYTELEAPEEYDLDTTPHRVYVTGDEMIIDFVNTGDIPVVAIASLAAVCLAGVAFITVRKFKLAKND